MTLIDYIIIAILAVFLIKGLSQGLVVQVMAIIGLVGGIYLAWKYYPMIAVLGVDIGIPLTVSAIIAFILIWAAVSITARVIGEVISKALKVLFIKWLDRLLGAVFGVLEGILLLLLTVLLLHYASPEKWSSYLNRNSRFYTRMTDIVDPYIDKCRDWEKKVQEIRDDLI